MAAIPYVTVIGSFSAVDSNMEFMLKTKAVDNVNAIYIYYCCNETTTREEHYAYG